MNLFVAAYAPASPIAPDRLRRAIERVVEAVPPLRGAVVQAWEASDRRAVVATASHPPERTGGVAYAVADEHRMACFAGRPYRWVDDASADGEGTLDPRLYLRPATDWAASLDGRFAALRYDAGEGALEVVTDAIGAYPVYGARLDGAGLVSNSASALREVVGHRGPRPEAVASFLGVGWSLGGDPLWEGVGRLPRGAITRLGPGDAWTATELLPTEEVARWFGAGLDADAAARTLTASAGAQARWPGRPNVVPLTAGRDSRVALAAALAAGVEVEAMTSALPHLPGFPETEDVRCARMLSEAVGVAHATAQVDPRIDVRRAYDVLDVASAGAYSLGGIAPADVQAFGRPPPVDPLPVFHTGAGGEIARAFYGLGAPRADALAPNLTRRLLRRWPRPLLSRAGRRVVEGYVERWVADAVAAGVAPIDVPDVFYAFERMQSWAGPQDALGEHLRDNASVLWGARVLRHQLALAPEERVREEFHRRTLEALRPDLARLPYGGAPGGGRIGRALGVARKARAELERRLRPRPSRDGAPFADPIRDASLIVQEGIERPADQVWEVVDRRRVLALAHRDPERLDPRSREQLWRLATLLHH